MPNTPDVYTRASIGACRSTPTCSELLRRRQARLSNPCDVQQRDQLMQREGFVQEGISASGRVGITFELFVVMTFDYFGYRSSLEYVCVFLDSESGHLQRVARRSEAGRCHVSAAARCARRCRALKRSTIQLRPNVQWPSLADRLCHEAPLPQLGGWLLGCPPSPWADGRSHGHLCSTRFAQTDALFRSAQVRTYDNRA